MKGKVPALLPRIVPPVSISLRELSKNYLLQQRGSKQLSLAKQFLSKGDKPAEHGTQPPVIGTSSLSNSFHSTLKCTSESRLNLLTPSPEAGPDIIDLHSSSDESDGDVQVYSLPPTPSISDDSEDLVLLTCLPAVTSVKTLEHVPEELTVYQCKWRGCELRWETREALHRHIINVHSQSTDLLEAMTCQWTDCSMFGKKSRTSVLFDRHVQSHTEALLYPCIMDGCTMRFGSEKSLQKHCSSHLRRKKEEELARSPKKRRCVYKPVQRKPYHKLVPDTVFSRDTMSCIQSKVSTLHHLTSRTNSIAFPSESTGSRTDSVTGSQHLVRAKHHSMLTRWSSSPNAKVTHSLAHCPDQALQHLGLLWKQTRSRKRKLK